VRGRARAIVQQQMRLRASRPQLKRDPLGGHEVEDLATLADFIEYDRPLYARVDRHVFLYGTAVIGIPAVLLLLIEGAPVGYALLEGLVLGAVVGLLMLLNARSGRRRWTRRRLSRIFANDPSLLPSPPDGATHRLICSLLLDKQIRLPGALYVVPNGFLFRSHFLVQGWRDWFLRRHPPPVPDIVLAPARHIRLDMGLLNQTRFGRWLVGYDIPVLVVSVLERAWAFRVPKTFETMTKLQAVLDQLRFLGGPAA